MADCLRGLIMEAWADVEKAIQAEKLMRHQKMNNLVNFSAFTLLGAAIWLAWPALNSAIEGKSGIISGLGLPIIILIWGVVVQDIVVDDAKARSRVGGGASIVWPILLMIGALNFDFTLSAETFGSALVVIIALSCYNSSTKTLQGNLGVLRFRSLMSGVGCLTSFSLFIGKMPEQMTLHWIVTVSILMLCFAEVSYTWVKGDDKKEIRKKFRKRLDRIENQLLELKAQGAAVDQASSLVTTAQEEGHIDPEFGMRLLDDAEENIERSISLAGDVEIIMQDALDAVEAAEEIAPIAKRPRKAFAAGVREVELGSLRDGELLFRQAKKSANEIIEWWRVAENAITEASRQLSGKTGDGVGHLVEMLNDAKEKLSSEKPKDAFEYAVVIPQQLAADGDAQAKAEESVSEANRQLKQTDGLDTSDMKKRLSNAQDELEKGNASQAMGLADGVVRTIIAERAAMDEVRKALRQRKKLKQQFESRDDVKVWQSKLDEIDAAADEKQWTHAATLLERMTKELDKEGRASDDALELYDFVMDEWRILRNQCEAAFIKVTDDDRRDCEQSIALAEEALGIGKITECLELLSKADSAMEKLRRRI
ncbi:MAG: hypothetical protein P8Q55_03960 [Candidatus Poseidoniaceae archaeon]|nr:hypothetical protein [Candidatus Poseidoniaceae archaeon]